MERMKTIRLAAVTLCMVTLSTAAAAGWVSGQAPDTVSLLSGKRANIFYAGEPVRFEHAAQHVVAHAGKIARW